MVYPPMFFSFSPLFPPLLSPLSSLPYQIPTLRGTILEETIPTSSKSNRGVPPREVIEYVTQGEVQISSLKLAKQDEKVKERERERGGGERK